MIGWRTERYERLREIRQWGVTEDAELIATEILDCLPDDWPKAAVGIFASFDDVDDESTGNGGINLQRTTEDIAVVEIDAGGAMEGCRVVGNVFESTLLSRAADAAKFLEMQ